MLGPKPLLPNGSNKVILTEFTAITVLSTNSTSSPSQTVRNIPCENQTWVINNTLNTDLKKKTDQYTTINNVPES